jgi:hypothetical protein
VLYQYFPVGGVRIEDDILITSKGYENLTTAPKGDAMFAIIRGQTTSSTLKSREKKMDTLEEPLRRAPGISKRVAGPLLKPVSRAATEPIPGIRRGSSEDAQAFQDHWLFTSPQKSAQATDNDRKQKSRQTGYHVAPAPQDSHLPLCGTLSADFEHIFMGWQNETRKNTTSAYMGIGIKSEAQKCQHCVVLSETVNRLRKTLSRSMRNSPTTTPRLGSGDNECPDGIRPLSTTTSNVLPLVRPQVPEMQQIGLADRTLRELSAPGYALPPSASGTQRGLNSGFRGEINGNANTLPQGKTQRRSVTFDNLPAIRPELPLSHEGNIAPSDWYTEPTDPRIHTQNNRRSQLMHNHPEPQKVSSGIPKAAPLSQWTFTDLPAHVSVPPPPPQAVRLPTTREARMPPDALAQGNFSDALGHRGPEQYMHPAHSMQRPDARPSLPNLRQAPLTGMARREGPASMRSRVPDAPTRQSTFAPVTTSAQEQELRRRRSMGGALRCPTEGHRGVPETQIPLGTSPRHAGSQAQAVPHWNDPRHRVERPEKETRALYARTRHGGEELPGVDYARW